MDESKLFGMAPAVPQPESADERRAAKLKKLAEVRSHVDTLADAEGHGIDASIKDTIAILNVYGIPTAQSCEGHAELGSGRPYPWVRVAVDNEPTERFVGEQAAFEAAAEEHGVNLEDLKRGSPDELYWQLRSQVSEREETPEYQAWSEKNQELQRVIKKLLGEFYAEREARDDVRIVIDGGVGDAFEIRSDEPEDKRIAFQEVAPEEFASIAEKLGLRQAEMRAFTDFILQKYLEN